MKRVPFTTLAALVAASAAAVLRAQSGGAPLPACAADNGGLQLPAGFCALVAADNLGIARQMAVAANGDLFVSLRNVDAKTPGGIVALRDTNGDGVFDLREKFGSEGGSGIALRPGYVYHAQETAIVRYPIRQDELKPSGPPEVMVTLPDQRGHRAKGLAFDGKGRMFVNVGVPSNACQALVNGNDRTPGTPGQNPCPLLEQHGGIWVFDEHKPGQSQHNGGRRYATGMRQMYALAWHDGALYAVQHGRDQLNDLFPAFFNAKQNAELPSEELLRVEEGSNFGWPYCYHDWMQGKRVEMPEYGGDGKKTGDCGKYPLPVAAYPGHWAPGAIAFYTGAQFPAKYRGGAFIAFQGSWNRAPEPMGGYNVVFQPMSGGKASGQYEVFADGFAGVKPLMKREEARHRPAGVAQANDGSLYISDLVKGRIWRLVYRGGGPSR
jgi:glucose/arabinose dehydrogenase